MQSNQTPRQIDAFDAWCVANDEPVTVTVDGEEIVVTATRTITFGEVTVGDIIVRTEELITSGTSEMITHYDLVIDTGSSQGGLVHLGLEGGGGISSERHATIAVVA